MKISDNEIEFSDIDLCEVFALFASPSEHELSQVYEPTGDHYFQNIELAEDYHLSYEKREFAVDALRAVLTFLYRHGYKVEKDGDVIRLDGILKHFA